MGDEVEMNGPDEPELFAYEWCLRCPCGATIDLAGSIIIPVERDDIDRDNYPYMTERVRRITGERTFDCFDCDRELTVSIGETGIAKWEAPDE